MPRTPPLDLHKLEARCRRAVAQYNPDAVVITDNRASEHKAKSLIPAVIVALLHTVDTSAPDAREELLACAAYCFDFMHGAAPAPRGGR